LVVEILVVLGALAAGGGAMAAEPSRQADPQEPPQVVHVAPVAPHILGIEIQAGRILPMRHIPYQQEPGDRIERRTNAKTGETREARLIRNGRAIGFLVGSERKILNVFEKLVGEPLDVARADQAQSYRISSPDDPAYRQGAAPLAAWRKTKSNNACDQDYAPTKRHWIYLKLPNPLSLEKRYFVRFPALRLNVPGVDFVYDPETTRSEAVHVSQIGFRPDDPGKCAFLSVWLGTGGGHSYAPGLRFALVDHRTGQQVYRGRVALAWKDSEPGQIGRKVNYNRTDVYRMDFGDFNRPGQYRVWVEGYFDVYMWAPVCEYSVDSSMIATEYVWGYLAARQ
jgi:endoglucanase